MSPRDSEQVAAVPEPQLHTQIGDLGPVREAQPEGRGADRERRKLRIHALDEILRVHILPREAILAPWLLTQSLSMIHAWRGVGKTFVALNIAYAVASGGKFLKWHASRPRPVLYLDGEMQASELQLRLRTIVGSGNLTANPKYFRVLTPDLQDGPMPDLATLEGQAAIEQDLEDAELIVVDNLSTLVRDVGRENDAESWKVVQEWALRMRQRKRAVLFVHHSGKGGGQRGSSKKEDTLDTVIRLRHPDDYRHEQGARFEVLYEKTRSVFGPDASPFQAALSVNGGKAIWDCAPIRASRLEQVVNLANQGHRQKEIAAVLEIDKAAVSRYMKTARAEGLVDADPPLEEESADATP